MDIKLNVNVTNIDYPLIWNPVDMLLQEIDILFNTNSHDVICSWYGWPNIKDYIFNTNISANTLKTKIIQLISTQCPTANDVQYEVDVKFMHGELSDIGLINVIIYDQTNNIQQTKEYYIG